MSDYTDDFYTLYKNYLNEKRVKEAHEDACKTLIGCNYWGNDIQDNKDFLALADFGCGRFQEILRFCEPQRYIGVDENAEENEELFAYRKYFFKENYRTMDLEKIKEFKPRSFVSLFSTEITAPWKENYEFYKKIFREIPSINSALVSGFYYESKIDENPIGETGDILSYQTLEGVEHTENDVFSEIRYTLHVPSQMFGEDVYEVWKYFTRI